MVKTYNNRYRDVERHVAHCIEQHKDNLEMYYIRGVYLHPIILRQFQERRI